MDIKKKSCVWCEKDNHSSIECYKVSTMSLEQRKEYLKKKKACNICLKIGHYGKSCKTFVKCLICKKRHSTLLCHQTMSEDTKPEKNFEKKENTLKNKEDNHPSAALSSCTPTGVTLLQTVVVNVSHNGKKIPIRALFDNGSQRSYIQQSVVEKLKIPLVKKEVISHCLFGGMEVNPKEHSLYNFNVESLVNNFNLELTAISQNCICTNVPKVNQNDTELFKLLKQNHVTLTDKGDISEIGLLIGADFAGFCMTNVVIQMGNGLAAIKTKLGWTLQGKQVSATLNNFTSTTLFCSNSNNDLTGYWALETLGIRDPAEVKSKAQIEEEVMMSFEENIEVNVEGRYEVQLPWKPHYNIICYKSVVSTVSQPNFLTGHFMLTTALPV
ncbi:uncharacterized protein LOC126381142 isoform X2 [Pectinophora gossypiella]|uniref:uncharacterized protein LOC126381142 isoform X2 n=1 Tax=Pectinophora gossypiella TaxID=13191 RepID=UPI00214E28E6|nr:uncharacterized protein LOC126381142 isoform X2 [Pectinophora gossypiella]XP_049886630.1 uncharacterized protein LOC126381142 isoform X2 [Pectinophora gossypiella]